MPNTMGGSGEGRAGFWNREGKAREGIGVGKGVRVGMSIVAGGSGDRSSRSAQASITQASITQASIKASITQKGMDPIIASHSSTREGATGGYLWRENCVYDDR